jgi:hypothetical protein
LGFLLSVKAGGMAFALRPWPQRSVFPNVPTGPAATPTRFAAVPIRLGDDGGTAESPARFAGMRACRPRSSLLQRVTFDEDTGELTITLPRDRRYAYLAVPQALYQELCRAASPGGFYNRFIKGQFDCRDLSPRRRFRPAEG